MLAMDDKASIFCAREIRGTISMAITLVPAFLAASMPLSLAAGLKKEMSVCPSRIFLPSDVSGWRTLTTTSASFHSVPVFFTTSTPASL